MNNLITFGRISFAIGVAAIGAQQIFYGQMKDIFLPFWPSGLPGFTIFSYLSGAVFIAAGVAIILKIRPREVAMLLGLLLIVLVVVQIPYRVITYGSNLGAWTDTFKALALAGGALIVAGTFSYKGYSLEMRPPLRFADKMIPLGSFFYAITMIIFGIDHFIYASFVATLVPAWIPWPVFWSYLTGVALLGSGVAIITKVKIQLVAGLLGLMIFLWFLFLHIPRAIADPHTYNGNEVTSVFQALAFSGIAFIVAAMAEKREALCTNINISTANTMGNSFLK